MDKIYCQKNNLYTELSSMDKDVGKTPDHLTLRNIKHSIFNMITGFSRFWSEVKLLYIIIRLLYRNVYNSALNQYPERVPGEWLLTPKALSSHSRNNTWQRKERSAHLCIDVDGCARNVNPGISYQSDRRAFQSGHLAVGNMLPLQPLHPARFTLRDDLCASMDDYILAKTQMKVSWLGNDNKQA